MMEYIRKVKRAMRDEHADRVTVIGGTLDEPLLTAPNGVYPVTIDGKIDNVRIEDDRIYCCKFDS